MTLGLAGDGAAQERLLRALAPILRDFFRRRMQGLADDVEDLVQETLISVHTRRASYDRDRPFTPWLYAIARHRLVDHLRRRKPTIRLEECETLLVAQGFEGAVGAKLDVDRLLDKVSAKQARAIRDIHIDGLTVAEASQRSSMGKSDVKVSVHRGLKALAASIGRSGGSEAALQGAGRTGSGLARSK